MKEGFLHPHLSETIFNCVVPSAPPLIAMEDCLKGVCLAGLPLLDQIHHLVNALGSKKVHFGRAWDFLKELRLFAKITKQAFVAPKVSCGY